MASKADLLRANALALLGLEYELGDEFHYQQGYVSTPGYPKDGDCSGLIYAAYADTDVPWSDGTDWWRLTADGYRRKAVKVTDKNYKTGDIGCFTNSKDRTYHITLVYEKTPGEFWSIEARGERWGVDTYPMNAAPDSILYRGAVVYRFPWIDLGEHSWELDENGLDPAVAAILEHADKATSQTTYDTRITSRILMGDYAGAVAISEGFYSRWPNDRGSLPKGIDAQQLQFMVEG